MEEWRSYRQTEVSRLSAGSVDNTPPRPGTRNGVLYTKALLPFVKERNKNRNLTPYVVVLISCRLFHISHSCMPFFSHLSRRGWLGLR